MSESEFTESKDLQDGVEKERRDVMLTSPKSEQDYKKIKMAMMIICIAVGFTTGG